MDEFNPHENWKPTAHKTTHRIELDQALLDDLGAPDPARRKQARLRLLQGGKAALPALSEVLTGGNRAARHEAVKALAVLKTPLAAPVLIQALEDDDFGVRWSAMDGLIDLERLGLPDLVDALRKDFDSVRLREGARRILHVLKENGGVLDTSLDRVLEALDSIEPEVKVPWAAEAAWKNLTQTK